MKNIKRVILLALLCALSFTAISCTQLDSSKKNRITIDALQVRIPQKTLIARAEIIIKGKVLEIADQFMTNPDGKRTLEDGSVIENAQITVYTVEIQQLYKGEYTDSTIQVLTSNGRGLSPDLILKGEDDTSILAEDLDRLDLTVGEECILMLAYGEQICEEAFGYYLCYGHAGYFTADGNGGYCNAKAVSPVTLTPETLPDDIAAAAANE